MPRHDLTDWIIHFIHDRNSENDPLEFSLHPETFEYLPFPENFNYEGKPPLPLVFTSGVSDKSNTRNT